MESSVDVVVVGGGNAGFTAAHAAAARGRRVVLLEKGTTDSAGGNSYYTAGAFRVAHKGLDDIRDLLEEDPRHAVTRLPAYEEDEFVQDMMRVTSGRADPDLVAVLVSESQSTLRWLHERGLRFRLMYERQAYQNDQGQEVFWGGLAVGTVDGGRGLIEQHMRAARQEGVTVEYGRRVTDLLLDDSGGVCGVQWESDDGPRTVRAESVVLAAGGFEANPDWRRMHLGQGWERAKVRGTPHNTGDLLRAALDVGAAPYGDWSTCHSVAWDARAENNESNRALTNQLTRGGYPIGIVVNTRGQRFLDEGADFRNLTYAKYGAQILQQPRSIAFQVFDSSTRELLRAEEYESAGASVVVADSLRDLAEQAGIDADGFTRTVADFNAGVDRQVPFDPSVKDGRRSQVTPPKSNWAQPLEQPPFYAYPVTCGITFTFGGLRSDTSGRVLTGSGAPIPGLFVCGEMLGGLFSGNYPGGTGLTAGSVFARRAGSLA